MKSTGKGPAQMVPWVGSGPATSMHRKTSELGGRPDDGEVHDRLPTPPEPSPQARLASIKAARNSLLEAAQALLRALADMPTMLNTEELQMFHTLLRREVVTFQSMCTDAQIKHEDIMAASYALCTALDEAAASTTWGGGKGGDVGRWADKHLALEFHGDSLGGDKVFLLIGRLAANPHQHIDLIELMFYVLGLGFEGRYRDGTGAHASSQLRTLRDALHTILIEAHGHVPAELSPHWKDTGAGKFQSLRSIPVWITVALLSVVLMGMFGWYKYQLGQLATEVNRSIRNIGATSPPPALQPAPRSHAAR